MTEPDKSLPDPSAGLEEKQSRLLSRAMTSAGITTGELWLRYFSIDGNAGEYEVDAYIQSVLSLLPGERDLLAHAATELIDELHPVRARPTSKTWTGRQGMKDNQADRSHSPDSWLVLHKD